MAKRLAQLLLLTLAAGAAAAADEPFKGRYRRREGVREATTGSGGVDGLHPHPTHTHVDDGPGIAERAAGRLYGPAR